MTSEISHAFSLVLYYLAGILSVDDFDHIRVFNPSRCRY